VASVHGCRPSKVAASCAFSIWLAERAQGIQLPAFAAEAEAAKIAQDKVIALVGERCTALAVEHA